MPFYTLKIIVALILSRLLNSKVIIVCIIVGFIVMIPFNQSGEIKGKVIQINDYSTVISHRFQNYKIMTSYSGSLDDVVIVSGELTTEELSVSDHSKRIVGKIEKVEEFRLSKKGKTIRSFLWNQFKDDSFLRSILFNEYLEDFPLMSSLSMQLGGLLSMVVYALRYRLERKDIRSIQLVMIAVYGVIFGISFGVLRLFISRLKLSREKQMVLLQCIYPNTVLYLGFIYPYAHDLIKGFSARLKEVPRYVVYPILMSLTTHRINFIEMLFFRIHRIVCALLFVLVLLSLAVPLGPLVYSFASLYQTTMTSFTRFIVLGKINVIFVAIFLILSYQRKLQYGLISILIGFVLMVYPLHTRVSFLNVGQGDATLIQMPFNAYTILIDTAHPNAQSQLLKSLNRYGVNRIDELILTHDDLDHVGNVDAIKDRIQNIIDQKYHDVPFLVKYLDDVEYEDPNANSLIFGFNTERTSFLFMGDAGIDQERVLIKEHPFLKVDVLKLGHHGSKTSTSKDFLSSIQPNYGIVSAHPRAYGHPHVEVMNSLYRFRVKPLLTHDSGNIRFVSGFLFDYVLTDAFGFGIIR